MYREVHIYSIQHANICPKNYKLQVDKYWYRILYGWTDGVFYLPIKDCKLYESFIKYTVDDFILQYIFGILSEAQKVFLEFKNCQKQV
jgi:hypothetical protein